MTLLIPLITLTLAYALQLSRDQSAKEGGSASLSDKSAKKPGPREQLMTLREGIRVLKDQLELLKQLEQEGEQTGRVLNKVAA